MTIARSPSSGTDGSASYPKQCTGCTSQSRLFIKTAFKADPIKTVVVTYHCRMRDLSHHGSRATCSMPLMTDLSAVIEAGRPVLWVHGRTHDSCNYTLGTLIVCNPCGHDDENAVFNPAMVVQILGGNRSGHMPSAAGIEKSFKALRPRGELQQCAPSDWSLGAAIRSPRAVICNGQSGCRRAAHVPRLISS